MNIHTTMDDSEHIHPEPIWLPVSRPGTRAKRFLFGLDRPLPERGEEARCKTIKAMRVM